MADLVVNVSGRRFEVERCLLTIFPDSTLGRLACLNQKEFNYQRPAAVFESVLAYYQTGHLHLPVSVCPGSVQVRIGVLPVYIYRLYPDDHIKCETGCFMQNQYFLLFISKGACI